MTQQRLVTLMMVAVAVAIGCGSSTPQDASATTKTANQRAGAPIQLAEAPAGAQPAAGTASIHGSIKFQGTAPTAEKIKMDADPVCKQQHAEAVYSEEVAVNGNGTLKNVFVSVKGGVSGAFPAPVSPVVLNQQGCWYVPHVFGIQVDQPLEILNSDASLHNINAKPVVNTPFNVAQPVKGMKTTKKFTKPETGIKFKCNVHPWMNAYGHVLSHPFFGVSGVDGSFTISGLPAGTYTIEAWHEKYGTQTQSVTVADGESKSLDFTFPAP